MDFYSFAVTKFQIGFTRALDADEFYLSHTAHVDGTLFASNFVHLGWFSDGIHQTDGAGLPSVVINDPSVTVDFVFQLVNAGNASSETAEAALLGTAEQLIGIGAGCKTGGSLVSGLVSAIPASGAWAVAFKGFAKLWDWLHADCDGPVAVDKLSGTRFAIDTWADDDPTGSISVIEKDYGGTDSPSGCGSNSAYRVTWVARHWRGWSEVRDRHGKELNSATGVSVASHNGALHVFGAAPGVGVTHSRTFSGTDWQVNLLAGFERDDFFLVNALPPSAISFDDRLHLFCVLDDGSIWRLGHTVDGGSWATSGARPPVGLTTLQPIATVEFGHRLYIFARDGATSVLRFTSSSDLLMWSQWEDVPGVGLRPDSPVTAAVLRDRLFLFGIYDTRKPPESKVVVVTSTDDTLVWTPWAMVEEGVRPEGRPAVDQPLDVAATSFGDRLYLASRCPESQTDPGPYVAVDFSGDGTNWSGWRLPPSTLAFQPGDTPAAAANGNQVYVLAPILNLTGEAEASVWRFDGPELVPKITREFARASAGEVGVIAAGLASQFDHDDLNAEQRRLHLLPPRCELDADAGESARSLPKLARKADIIFGSARVAFVDGCFWHGCPDPFTVTAARRHSRRAPSSQSRAVFAQFKWCVRSRVDCPTRGCRAHVVLAWDRRV